MSEWQPIDTAPTDGTVIDVWAEKRYQNAWCHHGLWKYEGGYGDDDVIPNSPTHWMPLPAAPAKIKHTANITAACGKTMNMTAMQQKEIGLPSLSDAMYTGDGDGELIITDLPSTQVFDYESIMLCVGNNGVFVPVFEYRPQPPSANGDHHAFKVFINGHRVQSKESDQPPIE